MANINLLQNRAFLLDQDLRESRDWQIYYESSPGIKAQIIQSNGTNPKINRLSLKQLSDFQNVSNLVPSYMVRVVLNTVIEPILRTNKNYFLSLDGGITSIKTICVHIEPSKSQGLYYTLYLQELN